MKATEQLTLSPDLLVTLQRLVDVLERQSAAPPPELIDAAGVAAVLGIGERTVRRLDVEGRLPMPVKLGGASVGDFLSCAAGLTPDALVDKNGKQ